MNHSKYIDFIKELKFESEIDAEKKPISLENIKLLFQDVIYLNKWINYKIKQGGILRVNRKTTKRNGQIITDYLHITIIKPDGSFSYYREQKNGNIKHIDSGYI